MLVLATTRPNEPPVTTTQHHLHGKTALTQKVAVMYRHLLKLPTTSCVHLEPFTFKQTQALMLVGVGVGCGWVHVRVRVRVRVRVSGGGGCLCVCG